MAEPSEPVLRDPYLGAPATAPRRLGSSARRIAIGALLLALGAAIGVGAMLGAGPLLPKESEHVVTVKPSSTLLLAVRDLARLETTELHFEKVIDVSEEQRRAFGLVEAKDSVLLVAVGDATVGVDLGKIQDGDVSMNDQGKAAIRLPPPELLSVRLDENKTYVHRRSTDMLAKRNEALEARARREAVAAIEKAAKESDALARARKQAERTLRALAISLGAKEVDITWR